MQAVVAALVEITAVVVAMAEAGGGGRGTQGGLKVVVDKVLMEDC
jgi:hypothetical protein